MQLVGSEHDIEASDSLHSMLKAVRGSGGPDHNDLINAAMRGDDQTAEQLLALFDPPRVAVDLRYPLRIAAWGGDFSIAERVSQSQTRTDVHAIRLEGHLNLAELFVARGRWRAASTELDRAADLDPGRARMLRGVLATLPFLSIPPDDLERVMEDLQHWSPPSPERGSPPERAYDQHVRLYLMALLSSKLGDTSGALENANAIEELEDAAETAVPGELATTIRADVAWRQGSSPADVLRALDPLRGQVPAVLWDHPAFGQEHARYIRASVLHQAGDNDEALRWLEDTFKLTPGAVYYQAPVRYLSARVLDASERGEEATEVRARYRELWVDADDDRGISLPGA